MINHSNPGFFSEQLAIRLRIKSAFFGIRILKGASAEMEFDSSFLMEINLYEA
jgi:hypothetical protein